MDVVGVGWRRDVVAVDLEEQAAGDPQPRPPRSQDVLLRLVDTTDVVMGSFRPGTLEFRISAEDHLLSHDEGVV